MRKFILLQMLLFTCVCVFADNHNQQSEFELKDQLEANESYMYEASSYIKLLDGFKCDPNPNCFVSFSLNRYGVFPPETGLLGGPPSSSCDGVVGALPGTLNVSDIGAAIYSIPIQLPKGLGDMMPDIAVTYNNQAGNGLLGWAWNLTGLSSIVRTGATKYHDGFSASVNFNQNDRFMLDGKRLMLSCSLPYGGDGTEYRTEMDERSKIVSHTSCAQNGPEYFTVYKADGTIYEYGHTADSYFELKNTNGKAYSWLVDKISDRNGNSILFYYDKNSDDGESYINHIEYTLNTEKSVDSMYDIVFQYDNRSDSENSYVYENIINSKKLLKKIIVTDVASGKELLCYTFDYLKPGNYESIYYPYNRLRYICLTADGMKLNSTKISWNSKKHYENKFQSYTLDKNVFNKVPFIGDFNGDGFSDVLLVPYKTGSSYSDNVNADVYINNGDGTFEEKSSFTFTFDKTLEWVYVVDFDGDGLSDIVPYYCNFEQSSSWRSKAEFYMNDGNLGFYKIGDDITYDRSFYLYPGDFCGEHRTSFYFLYNNEGVNGTYYPCVVYYKNGTPCQQSLGTSSYENVPKDIVIEDFNNDGKHEVIYLLDDKAVIANVQYANNCYSYSYKFTDYDLTAEDYLYSGDFNGDGNMDFLRYNQRDYWTVVISDGKKFLSPVSCLGSQLLNGVALQPQDRYAYSLRQLSSPTITIRTADFDGDGKCDVGLCKNFGGNYYFVLGTNMYQKDAENFDFKQTKRYYFGINFGHQYLHVGNFLGQENQSVLGSVNDTPTADENPKIVALNPHSSMYSVESITDGLGNSQSFEYDYLMPFKNNEMYSFDFEWISDNVRTVGVPIRAMKTHTVYTTNGEPFVNDYSYRNIWYHLDGHGIIGFHKSEIRSYVNNKQTQRKCVDKELSTMGDCAAALPSQVSTFDADDEMITCESFIYRKYIFIDNPKIVMPLQEMYRKITYNLGNSNQIAKVELTHNKYVTDMNNKNYRSIVNLKSSTVCADDQDKGFDVNAYDYRTCNEYTYNNNVNNWVVNRFATIKISRIKRNENAVGHCESFTYYNSGNPFRVKTKTSIPNLTWNSNDPLTVVTTYTYDKVGNVVQQLQTSKSVKASRLTKVEYASDYNFRFPTAIVNEKGWRTVMTYSDFYGLSSNSTDYNNFEMSNTDDILGVTSACTMPDGMEKIRTKRWASGNKHAPKDAMYYYWEKSTGKAESMVFYHKNGKELRNVTFGLNGEAIYVDMTYDDYGNLASRSYPYIAGNEAGIVYLIYDKYDRIVEENFPNGMRHEYSYDGFEKTMTTVSPDGKTQSKTELTNEMGWVIQSVDVGCNTVSFEYYSDGLIKSSQVGDNVATKVTYEYDGRRQKIKLDDPASGVTKYKYDAFGNLINMVTSKNGTISYTYDQTGAMLTRRIDDGNGDIVDTQWIYDYSKGKKGMLKQIIHGDSHVTNYSYDDLLHLTSVTETIDGIDYVTSYEYDLAGREFRKTYPSGIIIEMLYSNSGFYKSMYDVDDKKMLWRSDETDAFGNVTDYQLGNGIKTTLGYDDDFKFLKSIYTCNEKKTYQNLSYSYDSFGNLINRSKHSGSNVSESFEYDEFNRLVEIKLNGKTTGSMSYDEYGNMLDKTINGTEIFYDAEYGNSNPYSILSAKTDVDHSNIFSHAINYTAFDKVSSAVNSCASMSLGYDADLNRDKMSVMSDGVLTEKIYVGDCEFVEKNNSTCIYTYLNGPMGVFAVMRIDANDNKSMYYIHKDHLGSWCVITDEDAKIVQETSYDAWGNLRNANNWSGTYYGGLMCDRGFTGHEHILPFGLINMNGRVYDPETSMMLSPDNYIQDQNFSQNYNRYRYCYNNPLSYNDPSGEVAEWLLEGVFWGVMNVISHFDDIDGFGEGVLAFGAGFVYGWLTHGLGECSWGVQVLCGVTANVVKTGVNNFVSQNDGSYNWESIDLTSLKKDVMFAFGYGLASSALNAYIVYPTDETPGVSLGTLICEGYKEGHILETTVSDYLGNMFSGDGTVGGLDLASIGIDMKEVLPEVIEALKIYFPDSKLVAILDGVSTLASFINGYFGGGGNGGGIKGNLGDGIMNAVMPSLPIIGESNLNMPLCYSNVRSLISNK